MEDIPAQHTDPLIALIDRCFIWGASLGVNDSFCLGSIPTQEGQKGQKGQKGQLALLAFLALLIDHGS
jgi:hypothetical protein